MDSSRHSFKRAGVFFDRILNALFVFAGILLAFATVSVALGIVSRYFFNRPWGWVTEISEYILLYIAFLIGAWVLRQEEHVKMDIILNLLPPGARTIMNTITSLLSAIVCLVIAVFGGRVTLELYRSKAFTYTILELPKFIIASVICIGAFMLFVQFLRRTYGYWAHSNGSDEQL
jgi:TRAP-type C4-dicarboxylate transport system permease small subunit